MLGGSLKDRGRGSDQATGSEGQTPKEEGALSSRQHSHSHSHSHSQGTERDKG